MSVVVRRVYVPSNTRAQMQRARARRGAPPSTMLSMQEFLLSNGPQKAALAAARDIAAGAVSLAITELTSDYSTGAYRNSIDVVAIPPVVIGGNPRAAAAVTANGGQAHWTGRIDPESSHAAFVEFDVPAGSDASPRPRQGRRILGRAGAPFNTPRRPA